MKSILCVCVGNICRSPMVAALVQDRLGAAATVESAGIFGLSGSSAPPEAVQVAREHDLDIAQHRARHVRELDLARYDRVLALTPSIARVLIDEYGVAAERIVELDVEDPYGREVDAYRQCFETIRIQIDFQSLRDLDESV